MIRWISFVACLLQIVGVLILTSAALRFSHLAGIRRRVAWKLLTELHIRRGIQGRNLADLNKELDQLEKEEREKLYNG